MPRTNELLIELFDRLEIDTERGQLTTYGPDFFEKHIEEFKHIRAELECKREGDG